MFHFKRKRGNGNNSDFGGQGVIKKLGGGGGGGGRGVNGYSELGKGVIKNGGGGSLVLRIWGKGTQKGGRGG